MRLGSTARDVITGFEGVVIGTCQYLTGCNQVLLQPRGDTVSKRPDSEWFDAQRLEPVDGVVDVVLDNSLTPGCDREAPKR